MFTRRFKLREYPIDGTSQAYVDALDYIFTDRLGIRVTSEKLQHDYGFTKNEADYVARMAYSTYQDLTGDKPRHLSLA